MKIKPKTRQVICKACADLEKAITAYIEKADDDMGDQLNDAGYVDSDGTVDHINDLADSIEDAINDDYKSVADDLTDDGNLKHYIAHRFKKHLNNNKMEETIRVSFADQMEDYILEIGNLYLQETDPKLVMEKTSKRTAAWIDEWGEALGQLMHLEDHTKLDKILQDALTNGTDIPTVARTIEDEGIRTAPYRARFTAVTEILTAHSVANQEAMDQNPAVNRKRWRHTGTHKNEPRQNHVEMDGKTVNVDETYTLQGADGVEYHPMYPRDPILPAGERINCHCLSQAIVDDDVLGMTLEERQKLQQEAIDQMDDDWEKELDAKNKAKAGITEGE